MPNCGGQEHIKEKLKVKESKVIVQEASYQEV